MIIFSDEEESSATGAKFEIAFRVQSRSEPIATNGPATLGNTTIDYTFAVQTPMNACCANEEKGIERQAKFCFSTKPLFLSRAECINGAMAFRSNEVSVGGAAKLEKVATVLIQAHTQDFILKGAQHYVE
ncbi:hypothetical protein CEXT_41181 [Caerostris extrusa]|uniref:Uncharacterized protein n=1 Tax=Caerostris extrusa TaxID=172846 RepID=A0AAV4QFU5_CAEEX|nr:hypothetical protein CEXT_41181 [Caerostris extrusa]